MGRRLPLAIIPVLAVTALGQPPSEPPSVRDGGPQNSAAQSGAEDPAFETARKALAEGRPTDARTAIAGWMRSHRRNKSPQMAQALVLHGDAVTAAGDEYAALYDYERAINEFPETTSFATAVNRELDIGVRYVNGLRRMSDGVRSKPSEDVGVELLIRVQERTPGSAAGERASLEIADYYDRTHDFALAVAAYDLFLQNYPGSTQKSHAQRRRLFAVAIRSLPTVLLYLASAAALLVFALFGRRWMRRRERLRTGRCTKCGYDLNGIPHDAQSLAICPECGHRV